MGMFTILRNSKTRDNSSFLWVYLVFILLDVQMLAVGSYNSTTSPISGNETTTTVLTLHTSLAFGNITTLLPNVTIPGNNVTNSTNVSTTPFSVNLTTTSAYVATPSSNATLNGSTSSPFGNLTTTSAYVATPSSNATLNGSTSSPFGNLTTTSAYVATPSPNATLNGSTSSPFGNLTTTIPSATTLQIEINTFQNVTTLPLTTTTLLTTTTIFQTPSESHTTVNPNERIRNKIKRASDNSTKIIHVFNEIENGMTAFSSIEKDDDSAYSENLGDGISNLTNALDEKDFPENEWISITKASINLNSKLNSNMGEAKMALNNMILKTSYKIIDKQPPNEKFYLKNQYADVAGIKSSPDNMEGFELQTNYGDVIVSPDLRESDSTLLFKMVCYKNDANIKQTVTNEVQMSTVFVSLVDTKDNMVANNDPDKTYKVVLKSKETSAKPWQGIGGTSNGMSALEIPLTENALSLVELSSTDVKVWGKVNEAPTRYNYHFYYSALNGDTNAETIVKVDNIQIKKYKSVLRVAVQSSGPRDKLFMLVDHQGAERLNKRAAPAQLMTKTTTLKPFVKKDKTSNNWEKFNIKDTSVDENYNVILKTNLFGTFTSVVSFITPVPLDFAKIFVDFDKKVLNNPYVLIVLLLIFMLYCILALMVRRLDKKDQIKWLYMPLSDNNRSDPCQYLIRVQTGVRSSRVMSATPYFTLKGTDGETTIRILSDGVRKNLGSGTLSAYLLRTSKHLGSLLTLKIWHNNEGPSPRWFLSNIDIKDVTNSTWYTFPCQDWLSFDKGDGSIIRLLESHSNESDNFFTNIKTRIYIGLFEDHLYVSIVKRPRSSHFTRLQRLSTLVGVLYLSLISSAMYYKPNDKTPTRAFTLGPFTLSSKEIAVGLISSLIMVIPTSIIINLFRWRKVKGEKPDVCEESLSFFDRMKRFRLPWWSIYLAYFLIFLCIGTSAYFTFIYSILWGKELALQWLLSVVVNVTGSVILIQPVKIITLAMLTSCLMRSPQQDYADSNTDLSEEDGPRGEVKICPPPNMFTKTWKNKKRKMELNDKLFKIFQTFSFKIVFVVVCLIFLMNETINKRFIQNDAIERELQIGNLKQVNGTYAIWEWILKYAVPIIFPYKRYNGQVLKINDQRFLADQANLRLGAVRFRQIRTDGVWRKQNRIKSKLILPAFTYTSSAESGEIFEQIGSMIDYENGGYIIDINSRYKMVNRILLELRSFDWLDQKTRCLFICFNTYNANSGLYMQTIIQLEKPFLKNVIPVFKVTSFKFYPFVDLRDYFMLLMVVVLACIAIANVVNLVVYVWKTRTLLSWSVLVLLLSIISLLLIIIGYILRIDCLLAIRDKLIASPEKYISGDSLIIQDRIYLSGLCGLILVTSIGLCQPLSINYYFFLMKASITISLPYLRSFVVFLIVILSSFSSATYLLLSASLFSFRTLGSAYLTLFRIFLLLAKFKQTFKRDTSSFHFIFFAYTFFSAIILMNICVSILNDSFEYIKKMQREIGSEYMFDWELNQHFWDQLMNFFHSKHKIKPTEKVPVKENEDSENCLDSLSKMDKIFDVIIFHNETEKKTLKLKCLALYYMRCQYKSSSSKYAVDKTEIELETTDKLTNMLRVKKERNGNNRWTYWYYNDENQPLLNISFFCDDEDPGEIICRDILGESDILSKIQHGLISYTLLGPTIEIVSRSLQKIKKNSFEIIYFCLRPLHHYYYCKLIRSVDGQTWLGNQPQQITQPGVEEHILQDVIHVENLPSYLTLVRHHRREYLRWDNKNGEISSLLEPSLSLCLSSRDISKKTCTAILKMELEDRIFYPIIMITLNVKLEDPMIFRFQHRNTSEDSSLQLYTQTNAKEWNEESQIVKDKISFGAKPRANQETSYMLRPSQIKWDWRDQMKSMEDPLNEELFLELSQKIGNNWKELGKNLGIPPRAIHRIKNNTSVVRPEMACFEVLTQWHKFSVMTASKIQLLKSALSVIEEDLTHTVDDIAEKYENEYTKVIQESLKTKFFDQISRSEVMLSAWKELAIRLGLNRKEIENLDKCNTLTAREKCYNALMSWPNYSKETLRQQLAEMGFTFLADKISIDEGKNDY